MKLFIKDCKNLQVMYFFIAGVYCSLLLNCKFWMIRKMYRTLQVMLSYEYLNNKLEILTRSQNNNEGYYSILDCELI